MKQAITLSCTHGVEPSRHVAAESTNGPLEIPPKDTSCCKWWGTKSTELLRCKNVSKCLSEDNTKLEPSKWVTVSGYVAKLQCFESKISSFCYYPVIATQQGNTNDFMAILYWNDVGRHPYDLINYWSLMLTFSKHLNTFFIEQGLVDFVLHHFHWKSFRKRSLHDQYKQEEWLQQAQSLC